MRTLPERVGGSRIAFKPHLRAHVVSDEEVALLGENERFALLGRTYATLAPLLDGSRDADQVAAAIDGALPPEMTYFAIEQLRSRGYTTELPASCDDQWSVWWQAQGDDHATGSSASAAAHLAIAALGVASELAEAFAGRLGRSVTVAETAATLEVVLVDDYLRQELGERIDRALAAGRTCLPVRPVGLQIWLGPLCRPEAPPDWPALVARLRDNRPADVVVIDQGHDFPVVPAVATTQTEALGLNLAAHIALRAAAGEVPKPIDAAIWTFDTKTFEARSHPLPAKPQADWLPAGDSISARPIELKPTPKRYIADGGHRACPPEDTLGRLSPLISPITGIVPAIERSPSAPGVHVYTAIQTFGGTRHSSRENRKLGSPRGALGKGQTDVQARVSCLAEAIERYSCGFFNDVPRRRTRLDDLGADALDPRAILLFSELQYAHRNKLNKKYGKAVHWIPEPFDPERAVEWTPVWSLTEKRTRWVPSALCYFGYDFAGAPRVASGNSNGCAAGNTVEEAILQGLFELIERDACALWWYNQVRRPAIDLTSFQQPFFMAMQRYHRDSGRVLHVLDLRTDIGVPVAIAVSWREADGGGILFGLGCHTEPRLAVSRALTELNQTMAFDLAGEASGRDKVDLETLKWFNEARVENQPYVTPADHQVVEASAFEDLSSHDIATDIRSCIERLCELGYETLVLDQTRPDIGFPVVRVIVPGLRHFWARLAPGRLYDAPVALGWLDRAKSEEDLNPIPFF